VPLNIQFLENLHFQFIAKKIFPYFCRNQNDAKNQHLKEEKGCCSSHQKDNNSEEK